MNYQETTETLEELTLKAKEEQYAQSHLREMAVVGRMAATPKWDGMKLEIETSEYKGTGEMPHLHLYPANHKSGERSGLITRIALTENPPETTNDLRPIKDNAEIPKDYLLPILEWSRKSNKRGVNNWQSALVVWDSIQASVSHGQI